MKELLSGSKLRTGAAILLGVLVLVGALVWGIRGGREKGDAALGPEPLELARDSAPSEGLPSAARVALDPSTDPPAEDGDSSAGPVTEESSRVMYESSVEYLQDYWGSRWPGLRAELESRVPERLARYEALTLTQDLVPPPLSEIEDEVIRLFLEEYDRERTRHYLAWRADAEPWPERITASFLQEKLGVAESRADPGLIQTVQRVADSHRPGLTEKRRRFFDSARSAVERELRAGAYVAWPLLVVGTGMDPRTGAAPRQPSEAGVDVSLRLVAMRGLWHLSLSVYAAEYPRVHEQRFELESLGAARLREAAAAVRR